MDRRTPRSSDNNNNRNNNNTRYPWQDISSTPNDYVPRNYTNPRQNYRASNFSNDVRNAGFSWNPNAAEFRPSSFVSNTIRTQNFDNISLNNVSADTLRDRLGEQFKLETYECMICCEKVRRYDHIWSCQQCYHAFHLHCVKKWAKSSFLSDPTQPIDETTGWRCPGCQFVTLQTLVVEYRCFCGLENLAQSQQQTFMYNQAHRSHAAYGMPHSCSQPCRRRRKPNCNHPCALLCHPGPCPPCPKVVSRQCECGDATKQVRCGAEKFQCGKICHKLLNCGKHTCEVVCHSGPCQDCSLSIDLTCFCGKTHRKGVCTLRNNQFDCADVCALPLTCGNHKCERKCHKPPCDACRTAPEVVTACPCDKKRIDALLDPGGGRTSCLDAWPTCGEICGKELKCGPEGGRHKCQELCHVLPECAPCPLKSKVQCRCGAFNDEIPCCKVANVTAENPYLCEKSCGKKKSCKVHKCTEKCCNDIEHLCLLVCGKKLLCGVHSCDRLCHRDKCRPCTVVSFDELRCYCGFEVIYPPVPCGTRPPPCQNQCTRQHACEHPVTHACHSEPTCPPCSHLTAKMCYGGHETRRNIPCFLDDVSCGKPCCKALPCGQHVCMRACHKAECVNVSDSSFKCSQPCVIPRRTCGHACRLPCHGNAECPVTSPCTLKVTVTCKCGRIKNAVKCCDVRDVAPTEAEPKNERNLQYLQCDEECNRLDRNRRLFYALKLDKEKYDPENIYDTRTPLYTECLKTYFKTHSSFIVKLEKIFAELIEQAENSKSAAKTKSHHFTTMDKDQRRIVYEMAAFYNIETQSYDNEPIRNIVAKATATQSKVPIILLSTMMNKELRPIFAQKLAAPTVLRSETSSSSSHDWENLTQANVKILKR